MQKTIYCWCLFFLSSVIAGGIVYLFYSPQQPKILLHTISPKADDQLTISLDSPPRLSLVGSIATFSGEVNWQSRFATAASSLQKFQTPIEQGSALQTADNGKITINFPDLGKLFLQPNSSLQFTQTLPIHTVLLQSQGKIAYDHSGNVALSVHIHHAIIDLAKGSMSIAIDPINGIVTGIVSSGSATLAFNDAQQTTQLLPLLSPLTFRYNDDARTFRIISR